MVGDYRKGVFIVVCRIEKSILGRKRIKYLVLKRKLHWTGWEFPKGGVDGRESFKKNVVREIFEETGMKGFNLKEYKVSGRYRYSKVLKDRPNKIGQTYKLFSAEISGKKVSFDQKEHSDFRWVNFRKAKEMLKYSNQKKCLKIVDDYLNCEVI